MNFESCRNCIFSANTAEEVVALLWNPPRRCEHCEYSAEMRQLADQFQRRLPQWWTVNGTVVVPTWIVELLQRHIENVVRRAPVRSQMH